MKHTHILTHAHLGRRGCSPNLADCTYLPLNGHLVLSFIPFVLTNIVNESLNNAILPCSLFVQNTRLQVHFKRKLWSDSARKKCVVVTKGYEQQRLYSSVDHTQYTFRKMLPEPSGCRRLGPVVKVRTQQGTREAFGSVVK